MIFPRPAYLLGAVLAFPALLALAANAPSANDTYHIAFKPLAKHYCNFFGTVCHDHDNLDDAINAEVKECKGMGGDNFRLSCIYHIGNTTTESTDYVLSETKTIQSFQSLKSGPLKNYQTELDNVSSYCASAMAFCNGFCKGLGGHKLCKGRNPNDSQMVDYFDCKCAGVDYTIYIDHQVTYLWWMA